MNKILHTLIYGADVDSMLDGMHVETDMSGLEANAYEEACKSVLWSWSSNFRPEIAECIRTYLRASGLESIRRDFATMSDNFDKMVARVHALELANGELFHSAIVATGEATREARRANELEKLLDSALAGPQGARP